MGKKGESAGAKNRDQQRKKDLAKAERRRLQEKERAEARRKKTIELIRAGKLERGKKLPKSRVYSTQSISPARPAIRREDVVIDEHTTAKLSVSPYRLEGDNGW